MRSATARAFPAATSSGTWGGYRVAGRGVAEPLGNHGRGRRRTKLTSPILYGASSSGLAGGSPGSSRVAIIERRSGRSPITPALPNIVLAHGAKQTPAGPAQAHLDVDQHGFAWIPEDDFVNYFAADVDPVKQSSSCCAGRPDFTWRTP